MGPPTAQASSPGADLTSLLRGRWEPYDVEKMRRLKVIAAGVLAPILFVVILFLVNSISRLSGGPAFELQVVIAVAATLAAALGIAAKLRQMDREKRGWSFSALQDARLRWEELLPLARAFLAERNLAFAERTHRTATLFITYFDVAGRDFSMRLWFSKILTPHVVEVGFGPETPGNARVLRELRAAMSETFVKRYGSAAQG